MTLRRSLLRPLVPAYAAVLRGKEVLRGLGVLATHRLPEAVISVGSLSVGGAGKTPLVLALAQALTRRDYAVRILTRGYGRKGSVIERVDPAGDPARFGDEPVLLAQRSGLPVFVGSDRFRAGLLAQGTHSTQRIVYLLDDAFQHRRLGRDMDIVLLTQQDVTDTLLPAGNLREPLLRLRQADVVVVREDERDALEPFLRTHVQTIAEADDTQTPHPAVWSIRRTLVLPDTLRLPKHALAFCGIARPQTFPAMLKSQGVTIAEVVTFPDHHAYKASDLERLCQTARRIGADAFVTTEKDAVKLTGALRTQLEAVAPLIALRLDVTLVNEKAAVEQMISKVGQMNRRRRSPPR